MGRDQVPCSLGESRHELGSFARDASSRLGSFAPFPPPSWRFRLSITDLSKSAHRDRQSARAVTEMYDISEGMSLSRYDRYFPVRESGVNRHGQAGPQITRRSAIEPCKIFEIAEKTERNEMSVTLSVSRGADIIV